MNQSVGSRAAPSRRAREESNVKGKPDEPTARGMAPMALAHVVCCGALLRRGCHPAQQDSIFTSLPKVWAASFSPSTVVR
jgi:hypothetical protein